MTRRTVVVTGASKGIGWAVSERLASLDYQVIGIARTLPKTSFPGVFISCDLGNEQKTDQLLARLVKEFQVDALVNNMGAGGPQPLGSIEMDALRMMFDLNVRTAVQMTQGVVQGMKDRGWGRIVNLASRAIFGVKGRTSYAAAKSGLIGCTRVWALELAASGVTVNAVSPGPTETEMFRANRPVGSAEEKNTLASIPMQRFAQPQEIAAAIEFLISEDAGFITGQTLCVDGGGSL